MMLLDNNNHYHDEHAQWVWICVWPKSMKDTHVNLCMSVICQKCLEGLMKSMHKSLGKLTNFQISSNKEKMAELF